MTHSLTRIVRKRSRTHAPTCTERNPKPVPFPSFGGVNRPKSKSHARLLALNAHTPVPFLSVVRVNCPESNITRTFARIERSHTSPSAIGWQGGLLGAASSDGQVILDEEHDDDFEPTENGTSSQLQSMA
jgi:hypothetical protein